MSLLTFLSPFARPDVFPCSVALYVEGAHQSEDRPHQRPDHREMAKDMYGRAESSRKQVTVSAILLMLV